MPTSLGNVAVDRLLAEHTPALRNYLGARCRDADLTAELMQEVAARLVAAAPRLQLKNGNLRGYLFRIAASVWHDHLRRELVRRRGAHVLQDEERSALRRRTALRARVARCRAPRRRRAAGGAA